MKIICSVGLLFSTVCCAFVIGVVAGVQMVGSDSVPARPESTNTLTMTTTGPEGASAVAGLPG